VPEVTDTWRDKIALFLWRDRYSYDPSTGTVGDDNNVSLWTSSRTVRERLVGLVLNGNLWLGFMAGGFAVLAALLPGYVDRPKPSEQVNSNAGELRLNCIQQPDGILICRPVGWAQDQIITGTKPVDVNDSRSLNDDGTAAPKK
jgi:hypothetical protein